MWYRSPTVTKLQKRSGGNSLFPGGLDCRGSSKPSSDSEEVAERTELGGGRER